MGIIAKGAKCNVSGCDNDGFRSLNTKKLKELVYVYLLIAKRPLFAKIITKNGKKKLEMIDL